MKKTLIAIFISLNLSIVLDAQIVKSYDRPDEKEFKSAVKHMLSTSCVDPDTLSRLNSLGIIQREINNFPASEWTAFGKNWNWVNIDDLEYEGPLYFYRQAFNKVRKEVKKTKVPYGSVAIWNVYNMGYVVKTPTRTFGIDIVHKHIEELLPFLDFMLITHKHNDHTDGHTRNQMALAGVKAIAGYHLNKPCVWQGKLLTWEYVEEIDSIQIGDVTINCRRVDHNKADWGKNFVTTYEIDCGPSTGNTVIYHTGDAHNYRQLEVAQNPDIFIFHMAVGLNIQKALDKIRPKYAIFSHAWELGHNVDKYRWTIDDVLKAVHQVTGYESSRLLYPCWGDRLIYTKDTGLMK